MVVGYGVLALWNVAAVALAFWLRRRSHPRKLLARFTLVLTILFWSVALVFPFGTLLGLWRVFGISVEGDSVDPSQKARILAEGISEVMNCTAFAILLFAIPGAVSLVIFLRSPKESHEPHAQTR